MNLELFVAFCLAATVLIVMPGPVVTLVIATSLRDGTRAGLIAVAGANLGNALLVGAGAIGLSGLLALLASLFNVIRWIGAAYLIGLGVMAWRAQGAVSAVSAPSAPPRAGRAVFLQGAMVALANPNTIVFYLAFFPQFVDPTLPATPQLLAMSAVMILIALISDSFYALLAGRLRHWFTELRHRRLQARISGSLLIATGIGLLLLRHGG